MTHKGMTHKGMSRIAAELEQIKAETYANRSMVEHHDDHRAWVKAWVAGSEQGHAARRRADAISVRRDALQAAMIWIRFKPGGDVADINELLRLAERFAEWIEECTVD